MAGENELDLSATADQIGEQLFGEGGELDPGPDDLALKDPPARVEPKADVSDAVIVKDEVVPPAGTSAPPTPDDPLAKPPKTWKAEEAAEWDKLTPTQRAAIHRREEDFYKGIDGYKERAGRGEAFDRMMAPFVPALRHYGVQAEQVLPGLMHAHMTLALGRPEDKLGLIRSLCRDYKIDMAQLGGQAADAPLYVDPAVQALQAKVDGLESTQRNAEQAALAARKQKVSAEIEAFAKDPANSHFDAVADDMTVLIHGSGGQMALKEAYDRCVWANPVTRLKEQERVAAETAAAAKKAAEEAAAKAKEANAANVKTSQKRVGQTAPAGSMDDTIAETLAKIKARG